MNKDLKSYLKNNICIKIRLLIISHSKSIFIVPLMKPNLFVCYKLHFGVFFTF